MDSPEADISTRTLLRQVLQTELPRSPVTRSAQASSPRSRRSAKLRRSAAAVPSPHVTLRNKLKQTLRESVRKAPNDSSSKRLSTVSRQAVSPASLPGHDSLDEVTPRLLLRKIILTEPEVSLLVPDRPARDDPELQPSESSPGSNRPSTGTLDLDLPDLSTVNLTVAVQRISRKRPKRRVSVSQFERRMEQDGEDLEIQQSGTEDNLSELSGGAASSFSLTLKTPHMDLDSGKPGLQRKAVKRKAICVEDFEEGVQNYLHNKRSPGLEKSTSNPHKTLSETGALETFTLGFSALTVPDMTDNLMSNTKLYDHTSFILQTPHYAASLPLGPREDSGTNQTLDGMGPEEEEGPVAERKVEGSWLHPQTEVEGEEEKAEQDLEETGVETLEGSQQVGEEGDREEAGLEEEEEGEEEGEEVAAESQRRMGEVEGESRGLTDQEKEGSGIVVNEGDLDEMPQEMEVAGEAEEEEEEQQQAEHIARRATRSQGGLKLKSPDSLQGGKGDGSVIVDGELADETTRNSPTPLGSPRGASLDEGPPSSSPQPNRSRRTLSGADSEQGGGSGVMGESESESDLHAGEEWDKENSAPVPKLEASAPPGTPIPHSTTAVELGLSGQDEEEQLSSSDEEEDGSQSEELSMKTPAFLRAKKMPETPGALPTPTFLKNKPTRKLALTAATTKPPRKPRAASAKKEPGLPKSYIMSVFTHFAKTKVSRDIYPVLKETLDKYFDRLSDDLEAYAKHAKRKTIEKEDVELLLRRQGFVTERTPLNVLIERYLPLQYRQLLIPVATSGNKVIPKM